MLSSENFRAMFIVGGSYQELSQELSQISGRLIDTPLYWHQGIHVCDITRYSIQKSCSNTILNLKFIFRKSENLTQNLMNFIARNKMPFDTHCINEQVLLGGNSNTTDIFESINLLKSHDKRTLLSVFPYVSYNENSSSIVDKTTFLRNSLNHTYFGKIVNLTVAYIDWTNPKSSEWAHLGASIISALGIDGIRIQNNCLRDDSINVSRSFDTLLYRYLPEVIIILTTKFLENIAWFSFVEFYNVNGNDRFTECSSIKQQRLNCKFN